jgi:Skp family chaperone for outer membrane proteins
MMKLTWSIGLLLAALAIGGCDQIPGNGGGRIAVIDLEVVADSTGQDDAIQRQMDAAGNDLGEQLNQIAASLEARLADETAELGESEAEQIQQATIRAQQQYAEAQQVAQQRLQQYRGQLALHFRQTVQPVANDVAARLGAKVVLVAGATVLSVDESAVITEAVIAELVTRGIQFTDAEGIKPLITSTGSTGSSEAGAPAAGSSGAGDAPPAD